MTFSSSAVGTLTVSKSTLEKDILLALIADTISKGQINVDIKTGKKPVPTELKVLNNSTTLKQRSAIIRGLCGAALLNQMDAAPYYLLGGNATPGSPAEAVALASISSWMSVTDSHDNDAAFFHALDRHLETRAYLTPSAACTVADLDLSLKLFGSVEAFQYSNIARWLMQCHVVCTQMAASDPDIQVPALAVPPASPSAPVFFYEWEESALPKPKQQQQQAKSGGTDDDHKKDGQQPAQQQQGNKKEKAAAKQPPSKPQQQQQEAGADFDISALDVRVGKMNKVWPHEEADKLYCEEIDIGEESGPRSIASGLRPFYKAEDMQDKMVLVLANLKARTMLGFKSHGMVLCSSNADHTKVEIVSPPQGSKIGERVIFEGFEGKDPEPENKVAKKKIFEKLAPDLKTTADGIVVWKQATAKTSAGIIKGMPNGAVA